MRRTSLPILCAVIALALVGSGVASAAQQTVVIESATHHLGDGDGNEGIVFEKQFQLPSPWSNAVLSFNFTPPFGPNYESPPQVFVNNVALPSVQKFFPPVGVGPWQWNGDGSHDYNGTIHVSFTVPSLPQGTNTFRIQNGRPDDDYWFAQIQISSFGPIHLEFRTVPVSLDIAAGHSGQARVVVACLDAENHEVDGCEWDLTIAVDAIDRPVGGHLEVPANSAIHDPVCRPIGRLSPGLESPTPGCAGAVVYHQTNSFLVRLLGPLSYIPEPVHPVAGLVTFTATCSAPTVCAAAIAKMNLAVPGLIPVTETTGDTNPVLSIRGKRPDQGHVDNGFAEKSFGEALRGAATLFRNLLTTSGLPSRKWPRMVITDIALPSGGVYDVDPSPGDWTPPHSSHGAGIAADIRINYFSQIENGERCGRPKNETCSPEPPSPLVNSDELNRVLGLQRKALIDNGLNPYVVLGETPEDATNHWHVTPRSKTKTATPTAGSRLPLPNATVTGTATAISGSSNYQYSYVLDVPASSGSGIDAWTVRVGGTISQIVSPSGWTAVVTPDGEATRLLFTPTTTAVGADGVNVDAVQPGHSLGGFSFISTSTPGVIAYSAIGYLPWIVGSEQEAEDLAETAGTGSSVDGATVGPPAVSTALAVTPNHLDLGATALGSSGPIVAVTPPTTLHVSFTGTLPSWSASSDQPWLQITGGAASGDGQFTATINAAQGFNGLTLLTASITVAAPTAEPVVIPVTLTVNYATALNASHDLISLGIATTNMLPNSPGLDSRPLFSAAVEYAKTNHLAGVTVDPGAYYFLSLQNPDRHLELYAANNLTIDLQGAEIYLAYRQRIGIALDYSTNATLQNFTLDYLDLPFTQLHVDAVNAATRTVTYSIPQGWRDPNVFNVSQNPFGGGDSMFAFVFRDGQPVFDLSRMEVDRPFTGNTFHIKDDGFPWTTTQVLGRIQPGDVVVLTARGGGDAMVTTNCVGCALRNIDVFASASNGFYISESASTLVERAYVMPRPGTDRLISSNADGITIDQPKANNTVQLSRSIRTLDDGFSPHALVLGIVANQTGARQLVVTRQYANRILNGSPVAFERPTDGAFLGVAVITAQNPPPTQYVYGGSITIDFDRDLPGNLAGAAIYTTDANQRGKNLVIERNAVEDQVFARGMSLWGLMNSQIRKNYIWRADMPGIFAPHRLTADWMSPALDTVAITGNVVDGANRFGSGVLEKMAAIQLLAQKSDFQPMAVSPHLGVTIADNFIADPSRSAIRIENTTIGSATGNYLLNPNNRPYVDGYWEDTFEPYKTEFKMPVVVKTSTGVSSTNNTIDKLSGRLFATDLDSQSLAAYAPGATVRLNGYAIGLVSPTPTLTIKDADGVSRALATLGSGAHYVDVQLPPDSALGPSIVTASSGPRKWIATLFVDSADNIPFANGCTFVVSPSLPTLPPAQSALSVLVVTQPGCPYGVRTFDPFVAAGSHTTGTGVFEVTVAANTGASRTFDIEVAGQRVGIVQTDMTDVPIVSQLTVVKAVHIQELRTKINAIRANFGLGAFAWTDPTLIPGVTMVRTLHIAELRSALQAAYVAAGRTPPTFVDPVLAGVVIKAVHVNELRTAVAAIQ